MYNAIRLAMQSHTCFAIESACDFIATSIALQLCLYTGDPGYTAKKRWMRHSLMAG